MYNAKEKEKEKEKEKTMFVSLYFVYY